MADFFIHRPVFAWVIAILISLGGLLAVFTLPVESYPTVVPPQVVVSASYPGANADTVERTVTQVIEQQLKGIDGLLYFTGSSGSNGSTNITLTFETGTDPDTAVVQTQSRVAQAEPRLPLDVIQQGVSVQKANPGLLMVISLRSEDDSVGMYTLNNIVATQVLDPLQRLPGVGTVNQFGSEIGMRIWLNPDKLQAYGMSAAQVLSTVRQQNVQFASGSIGARPALPGQQITASVAAEGRFTSPEQFADIIVRADPNGAMVRLKDVARVELGPLSYAFENRAKGPTASFNIQTLPNANALEVAKAVKAKMAELDDTFPPGVQWVTVFDTTSFIEIAVQEVVLTLVEAVVLVFLVMLLFLQSFRATLIPMLVVPVALLGAGIGMYVLGFSINQLTLFAMVLAIGIVVDDAIVVIEAVERIMREEHLSPLEATRKAMRQITGAIIAITVVLSAVFIPAALQSGVVGGIYRQFALVIAVSMLFSAFLALSLTPALCASMLRPTHLKENPIFRAFNRAFTSSQAAYVRTLSTSLRHTPRWMASFAVLVVLAGVLYARLPTSFVPDEDLGIVVAIAELPPGASLDRTMATLERVEELLNKNDAIASISKVGGFSFIGQGENIGQCFIRLKHWNERDTTAQEVIQWAFRNVSGQINDARVLFISLPTIIGLGQVGGFDFYLEDRSGQGRPALDAALGTLLKETTQEKELARVRQNAVQPAPRLHLTVDRVQAQAMGVGVSDVYSAIQLMLAPVYVNDFFYEGRVRRVMMQADAPFRMTPDAFDNFYLPSTLDGDGTDRMIPLSSVVRSEWEVAAPTLSRFNGYPAVQVTGESAPGFSSGEAMTAMERIVREDLPGGFNFDWAGQALQERLSGNQAPLLFTLSVLIVFLCLAALYESWSTPVAVMLILPLGLLGAVLAVTLRGLPNDVFFKVGLITIIGLSAKNAILIVEFALEQQAHGKSLYDAVLEAARLRLRPILMTSFAFILGVFPLVVSTGAGANSRHAIGTGVVGGMMTAALLGVLLVPVFYVVVRRFMRDPLDETPSHAEPVAPTGEPPGRPAET
jgi:multidrug efflux pump